MSNIVKYCLVASLTLNAFLLGVGYRSFGHPHGPPPPPDPEKMMESLTEKLPPEDAHILRQAFDRERPVLGALHHDPRGMHQRVREALLAEPFDPQKLQAVFDTEEKGHADFGAALARMMVTAATEMSPQGRHLLAEAKPGPGGPGPGPK